MRFVFATFSVAESKHLTRSTVREGGFIWFTVEVMQSIMVGKSRLRVQEVADHIVSPGRKQRVNRSGASPRYPPLPVRLHPPKSSTAFPDAP